MPFRFLRQARAITASLIITALFGFSGCHRAASKEEKALRAELRQALHEHAYEKAAELARRHLKLKPQDNGTWGRLVQARFGMRDLAGVKQTLEEWRRAVPKPSLDLEEYAGDLAAEQRDGLLAVQAWSKVITAEPKNIQVLEKIARLEKTQQHWAAENDAWTAHIAVRDNAIARINRALCRRRLHRWQEAFEDLQRAQALAPEDPEVQRGARLLEQMGRSLADIRELDSALAVSPNDPGLLADRALLFLRSEDFELALEDAEAAGKFGPWAMRPKLFQALALIDLGRADECEKLAVHKLIRLEALTLEFLETIGRLDSEISAERNNAELYVARAWQLNEIGQPALALQDAETAAQLDPKAAGACAEASYALTKLGRAVEALQQIKRATELDENFATAWQYRGELEMARGETLSAIESFTHAIETNQTVMALQKREQCYRRLGLLVKAEQDRKAQEELSARATK
jgi:tetratricopeptide (TPR) repeat protein